MKRAFASVLVMAVIFITGCGGGGGGKNSTPSQSPKTPPDPPVGPITFKVDPGKEATQVVGTLTVNIPSEAFPGGSTLTVTQSVLNGNDKPPNDEIACNQVEIASTKVPKGAITITANGLKAETKGSQQIVYLLLKKVGDIWSKIADSVTGKFVIETNEFIQEGPASKATAVIGKVLISSPDSETGLWQIGSDDAKAPEKNVLVLVHGFNSRAESFDALAQKFTLQHRYRKIYSFKYDWRINCSQSAEMLGIELDKLKDEKKQIYILAHSMGVVVARYSLERLGKTKNVIFLYGVCGANLGSVWATAGELLVGLQNDYLNRLPGDHAINGFPIGSIESIADLVPGSSFLTSLNNPSTIGQCGLVNYCFVSSTNDPIVSEKSASGYGISFKTLTAGTYECYSTGNYGHSGLVQTPNGLQDLVFALGSLPYQDDVFFSGDVLSIKSNWDGWDYSISIYNQGSSDARLEDLRIDQYDRFSDWIGSNWYDPNTTSEALFPKTYVKWNRVLVPGKEITINLHTWPNSQKLAVSQSPDNVKSCDVVFTLRFSNDRGTYTTTTEKRLYTEGFNLESPKTRSFSGTQNAEKQGGTGNAK